MAIAFYSFDQLDVFDVIQTLRELDVSLEEIKGYMNQRSPKRLLKLFRKEQSIIRETDAAAEKDGRVDCKEE